MKSFKRSADGRLEKLAERRNLEQRKQVRDKRFHAVDDDTEIDDEYDAFLTNGEDDDEEN